MWSDADAVRSVSEWLTPMEFHSSDSNTLSSFEKVGIGRRFCSAHK